MDNYDYVMYGKVFKYKETANQLKVARQGAGRGSAEGRHQAVGQAQANTRQWHLPRCCRRQLYLI